MKKCFSLKRKKKKPKLLQLTLFKNKNQQTYMKKFFSLIKNPKSKKLFLNKNNRKLKNKLTSLKRRNKNKNK